MTTEDFDLFHHLHELAYGIAERSEIKWVRSPAAQTVIGRILLHGCGPIAADPTQACELLLAAANDNEPEAQFILGTDEAEFTELQQQAGLSEEDRARYFQAAVQSGFSLAVHEFRRRKVEEENSDYHWMWEDAQREDDRAVIKVQLPKARNGDTDAQLDCAEAYGSLGWLCLFEASRTTEQAEQDKLVSEYKAYSDHARTWTQRAAERSAEACFAMSHSFSANDSERVDWLKRAAFPDNGRQPSGPALCTFAARLQSGEGVRRDLKAARSCLESAIATGDAVAVEKLGIALLSHTLDVQDDARGAELLLSVKKPSPEAHLWLGLAYLRGQGMVANLEEARKQFELSHKGEDPWGSLALHMGWRDASLLHEAEEVIFEHLDKHSFVLTKGCPITKADVRLLLGANPQLCSLVLQGEKTEAEDATGFLQSEVMRTTVERLRRIFGESAFPLKTIEGLIAVSNAAGVAGGTLVDTLTMLWKHPGPLQHYVLGRLWQNGTFGYESPEKAKAHFESAANGVCEQLNTKDPRFRPKHEFLLSLERKARDHVTACVRQLEQVEAKQEILSFLSHTLTNAVAGTSETLRLIVRHLTTRGRESDESQTDVIERLSRLATTLALTESLVASFKLYASNPDALRESWKQDKDGEVPVRHAVALAIRQALSRFLLSPEHGRDFRRLAPEQNRKELSKEFVEGMLSLDMESDGDVEQLLGWIKTQLPCLRINAILNGAPKVVARGARFIVIFSVVSEMLTNAFKYGGTGSPISLDCIYSGETLQIRCVNANGLGAGAAVRGGRKGITFMRELCRLIGAQFEAPNPEEGFYRIGVVLR